MFAGKKGLIESELGKAVIAIAVLVLIIIAVVLLSGKATSALSYLKNIFRFS